MNSRVEHRLDKLVLFDRVAIASRIVRNEQQREGLIADRRRISRVPGAIVDFVPAAWVESGGVSQSYRTQLLAG
jgi:hypothetical protein